MNHREKYLLLKTVQEDNILPMTSVCNMKCQFCSHRQNPSSVEVYKFGHLDYELVEELISYLPREGPVVIGESASKIIEGEPFLHPHFEKILMQLRAKYSRKKIKITTNGSSLTEKKVRFLEELQPLQLNISLNCARPEQRAFLMGDSQPQAVFAGFNHLQETKIEYNGSIVALPHLLGWDYLQETVNLLRSYNCRTIRMFLPGFTDKTPAGLKFSTDLFYQLQQFAQAENNKSKIPVILEPPFLSDFKCRIKGIINDTPAERAGLSIDDIITGINGYQPMTRVDAFNKIVESKSPELTIIRGNKQYQLQLQKDKRQKPGFVVDYDLSPSTISSLKQEINNVDVNNIFIVTSKLAGDLINKIAGKIEEDIEKSPRLKVISVDNKFFGGSIMAAGLLVTGDIISALEKENTENCDLIILPQIIYDTFGKDLRGKSYHQIERYFEVEVKIIE